MRKRFAIALQLIAGLFGLYGIGRLIMRDGERGCAELIIGSGIMLFLWPMIRIPLWGRQPPQQVCPQIAVAILLTWSLARDLKSY